MLAGRRGVERPAEIGTGCGVGAAWIVSALRPSVPFVTVEVDAGCAAVAGRLFADDPAVTVIVGDWRAMLLPAAPFDLLFVDAASAKDDPDSVVGLLLPGATVVLADFTARVEQDPRRQAWLEHTGLVATVVGTGGGSETMVATRV